MLEQCDVDRKSIAASYYLFIERVMKCYVHRNTDTVTHINRACLIEQAIQDVFNTIPGSRPHGGRVTDALEPVLAVCELMLDMPPRIAKVGTQRWLDALCTVPNNITVKQMIEIPTNDYQLLRAFVRHQRKLSDHPFDYPPKTSRVAQLSAYIHSKTTKVLISPRQTSKNTKLPGCRNAACVWAFDKLRALGIAPVHCPAGLTPTSNIAPACHLFPYDASAVPVRRICCSRTGIHAVPVREHMLFPYGSTCCSRTGANKYFVLHSIQIWLGITSRRRYGGGSSTTYMHRAKYSPALPRDKSRILCSTVCITTGAKSTPLFTPSTGV